MLWDLLNACSKNPQCDRFHRGPLPGISLHPLKSKPIFQRPADHHLWAGLSRYFPTLSSGPQAARPRERKEAIKINVKLCIHLKDQQVQRLCSLNFYLDTEFAARSSPSEDNYVPHCSEMDRLLQARCPSLLGARVGPSPYFRVVHESIQNIFPRTKEQSFSEDKIKPQ